MVTIRVNLDWVFPQWHQTVMNNEKWICWLLVANCNYFTTRKNPCASKKCMLTGLPVVGSHYWRQLEMMYMKNITSGGELSQAALFSLTPPMIVSVSAKWMHACWMCNAAPQLLVNRGKRLFHSAVHCFDQNEYMITKYLFGITIWWFIIGFSFLFFFLITITYTLTSGQLFSTLTT